MKARLSLGLRRIGAYLIDYIFILIWMAGLAISADQGWISFGADIPKDPIARWKLQGQGFLFLTLPIFLYFTLSELSIFKATFGKRLIGLTVQGPSKNIIFRNILKFAPWEIAHAGIWHGMSVPFTTPPTTLGWCLLVSAQLIAITYLAGLFWGSGKPLYDRLARTEVRLQTH